jgi:predicted 3-demethylubiquinone-9 3-methyltransferase (glyoxalase superfamily)
MPAIQRISPCLWFTNQAEEAANFYVGIFRNSRIEKIARYGTAGQEHHHMPPGSVMTVAFMLDSQPFTALNGGSIFRFSEAISLQVSCDNQDEVDYFWRSLSADGDERAQQCGWLKDKYGLSWQIVPSIVPEMMVDPDHAKSARVMTAILKMKKPDIAELQRAFDGR